MWYKAITFLLITLIGIVCLIRITGQPGCEEGFLILNNSPATSQLLLSVWWCCCSILAELFGNLPFSLTDLFHQLLISFITCWSVFFHLLIGHIDCWYPRLFRCQAALGSPRVCLWRRKIGSQDEDDLIRSKVVHVDYDKSLSKLCWCSTWTLDCRTWWWPLALLGVSWGNSWFPFKHNFFIIGWTCSQEIHRH